MQAWAPSASALMTSVPRRTPDGPRWVMTEHSIGRVRSFLGNFGVIAGQRRDERDEQRRDGEHPAKGGARLDHLEAAF